MWWVGSVDTTDRAWDLIRSVSMAVSGFEGDSRLQLKSPVMMIFL